MSLTSVWQDILDRLAAVERRVPASGVPITTWAVVDSLSPLRVMLPDGAVLDVPTDTLTAGLTVGAKVRVELYGTTGRRAVVLGRAGTGTATESQAGIVTLATTAMAVAGTDTTHAVTPAGVRAASDSRLLVANMSAAVGSITTSEVQLTALSLTTPRAGRVAITLRLAHYSSVATDIIGVIVKRAGTSVLSWSTQANSGGASTGQGSLNAVVTDVTAGQAITVHADRAAGSGTITVSSGQIWMEYA